MNMKNEELCSLPLVEYSSIMPQASYACGVTTVIILHLTFNVVYAQLFSDASIICCP